MLFLLHFFKFSACHVCWYNSLLLRSGVVINFIVITTQQDRPYSVFSFEKHPQMCVYNAAFLSLIFG